MPILDLVLSHHWFDKIASGEKRHEYRTIKPYWTARLSSKRYSRVRFRRGYTNTIMFFELAGIDKFTGPNDLNLPEVYRLTLGKRLDAPEDGALGAALSAWPNLSPAEIDTLVTAGFVYRINNWLGIGALTGLTNAGRVALTRQRGGV